MNTSPTKSSLAKLGLSSKSRILRVLILGQNGVGKTALVVRFITKRFIGEYVSNQDKICTTQTIFDNESVQFDILDSAYHLDQEEKEVSNLESNIRWADAYILMYSVTDKCSFDECNRLRFLINYNKRRRKLVTNSNRDCLSEIPVVLVGNKIDQYGERMVSVDEGQRRFRELHCACFHEISVRENVDQVQAVFRDVFRFWRVFSKFPKLKRSTSDVDRFQKTPFIMNCEAMTLHDLPTITTDVHRSMLIFGGERVNEHNPSVEALVTHGEATNQNILCNKELTPFRSRASTDGTLLSRPRRWRYPPPGNGLSLSNRVERRMSISGRGSNASY